jgi:hypothetical protein
VCRPEGKRLLGKSVHNEIIILKGIFKKWMRKHELDQTQDKDSCRAFANAAMNICIA